MARNREALRAALEIRVSVTLQSRVAHTERDRPLGASCCPGLGNELMEMYPFPVFMHLTVQGTWTGDKPGLFLTASSASQSDHFLFRPTGHGGPSAEGLYAFRGP